MSDKFQRLIKRTELPCRTQPDLFHAESALGGDTDETLEAKQLCSTCPILLTCRYEALENDEKHGIWGALNPTERRAMSILGSRAA